MQWLVHFAWRFLNYVLWFLLIFSIFRITNKNINFVWMEIHVNNCIMPEDNFRTWQMYPYGDLHNDHKIMICIMIILWYLNLYMGILRVGIKVKIKMIKYVCICKLIRLHSSLPFRTDNRLEDRRQWWSWHRMVVLYTQIALETGSFTVPEHRTKMPVACQMLHLYFPKFIHKCSYSYNKY